MVSTRRLPEDLDPRAVWIAQKELIAGLVKKGFEDTLRLM
jgi:hypothetical protein